jgi:hypothetical protein
VSKRLLNSAAIEPERKTLPTPQSAQIGIGFHKDFLGYVLSIPEIAKFGIGKGIDALSIFVHKYAKSLRLSVQTSMNYATVISPHFKTPESQPPLPNILLAPPPPFPCSLFPIPYSLSIYATANGKNVTWNLRKIGRDAMMDKNANIQSTKGSGCIIIPV